VSVETLITIHDQALIDQCEAEGRFANVAPYRYLFVGPRHAERGPSTIVARDYWPNLERFPQFYDFTGWWAAAQHGHLWTDKVLCLQYDHQVTASTLMLQVGPMLDVSPMVAFVAGHRDAGNFMLHIGGFEDAYRAGLDVVGAPPLDDWPAFNEWPSTQGTAWRTDALREFMEWVTPLFDFWADNLWAGHLMERMPKAWLVATGQREAYLHGAVTHEGKDSHGTCHLMAGDTTTFHQRNATFGKVV
jgi:hypothetical protein